MFHSCGMVRPFIPDLTGLGVDVLDPIQPTGPEMQSEELKRNFGERLTFHGGIDMQDLLPNATPAQVEAEARRYCEVAGAGTSVSARRAAREYLGCLSWRGLVSPPWNAWPDTESQ